MISTLSEAGVGSIQVQVIDPSVFVLTEGLDQGDPQDAADPWEIFVKKLLRGFFTMSRQTRKDLLLALPSDLAHELETVLTGVPEVATHQTFSLLGEFLVGLAHRHHRQSLDEPTFNKIYSFIGGLSPEIRHQLIMNICRSTKTTSVFNERLLARLPGRELRRIMDALAQQREMPEGLLQLVQKLSSMGESPLQVGAAVSGSVS